MRAFFVYTPQSLLQGTLREGQKIPSESLEEDDRTTEESKNLKS